VPPRSAARVPRTYCSLTPSVLKTRPRLLAALATAHVQQGDVDRACEPGPEALGIAAQQEVQPNLQDVRKLRLDLEPWRDSQAVKDLDEQLRAVVLLSAPQRRFLVAPSLRHLTLDSLVGGGWRCGFRAQ
jgi:hypothetical protein